MSFFKSGLYICRNIVGVAVGKTVLYSWTSVHVESLGASVLDLIYYLDGQSEQQTIEAYRLHMYM